MEDFKNIQYLNSLYDSYKELLTAKQQECFELYFFEDYSLAEIADELNVSRNAIHNNLKKSISKLEEFEKKLKKWSRLKKQALIDENFERIQDLSECRNATHHKYKPDGDEINESFD